MADNTGPKLAALRKLMQSDKQPVDAYIIPTDDAHQTDYIADCDKRREYISGFTGSGGTAVVTQTEALLWTDGRYHQQASKELDHNWTLMKAGNPGVLKIEEWLSQKLPGDAKIGFDPHLASEDIYKAYSEALDLTGQQLVPVNQNLVDVVWGTDRPDRPTNPLIILQLKYSGRSWQDKVKDVRAKMEEKSASVLVVTALDEVAWLYNLRGSDVSYNPLFFAYAIITKDDARLYIDEGQVTPEVKQHLETDKEGGVLIFPYSTVSVHISQLLEKHEGKVWCPSERCYALCRLVPKVRRVKDLSPLQLLKGVKNETEIQGAKNCHIRDAAAVCEYFLWLEKEVPKGYITEIVASDKLEELRKEQSDYVSLSFATISGSGPNGSIIHYCAKPESCGTLSTQELYLCDSGGQYMDGTTDITRTVSFGTPTPKQKECFTLVLKGHIAMSRAVFPNKTMGNRIDCLARSALWRAGLDYKHSTGHGVGAFLSVHEGPHGISGTHPCAEPIQAGMLVTDEPGYYEDGNFGIRIENVTLVKPVETKYNFANTGYLTLEPVTLVPIQQKMIEPSMLTADEISWLNDYHDECMNKVGSYLADTGKAEVLKWLERETQTLG